MAERLYKCGLCREICRTTWSEDEALAEASAVFGPIPAEERVQVCDDCWKHMMQVMPPPGVGNC